MAGEIEALGALTTAGLAASTLDGPNRAADGHRGAYAATPHACANCATPLVGDFCHGCGQSAHVHRSIGHVLEEFLHGIWHFDSKAWRTLPLLVFKPGQLTRDYVYGKRARYIAPLALFLLSVFLMFFVFGFMGSPDFTELGKSGPTERAERLAEARKAVTDAREEVADAERELASAKADPEVPGVAIAPFDATLKLQRDTLASAQKRLETVEKSPPDKVVAATPKRTWQERLAADAKSGEIKVNTGFPEVDANILRALQNPEFALYRVQQKAYKLSFLLIPLSLPTLWLMFCWRRDVHTYDHVVFALYSLSFMSLLFIVAVLVSKLSAVVGAFETVVGWLLFAPLLHMYMQLHGAYRLGWFGALWRTVVLGIASIVTLALFAAMIVVVGLAD